jgi:hypothetical protein
MFYPQRVSLPIQSGTIARCKCKCLLGALFFEFEHAGSGLDQLNTKRKKAEKTTPFKPFLQTVA